MSSPTVASLQRINTDAILKFQVGALFMADASASLVTAPFDSNGLLQALPAGYQSGGSTDTGGLGVGRAISVSEVAIWQSVQPARSDVTADKLTVKVKFEEQNPVTLALQEGLNLSDVNLLPTFSNVRDTTGRQPKRRLLLLAEDQVHNVIVARHLPNAILTAISSDQVYSRANETQLDVQFDCYPDGLLLDANGNPSDSQFWLGGSGWAAIAGEVEPPTAWAATTAYTVGQEVTLSGDVLQCTTAGTSGSTAPTPPASIGGTVTDGTVTWKRVS